VRLSFSVHAASSAVSGNKLADRRPTKGDLRTQAQTFGRDGKRLRETFAQIEFLRTVRIARRMASRYANVNDCLPGRDVGDGQVSVDAGIISVSSSAMPSDSTRTARFSSSGSFHRIVIRRLNS
jgi:hypothetical protein